MKKQKSCYFGFTLAEVLITLGIIGVVAALTIPNLITNYQKQQTVEQLKKTYSQLGQVVNLSINDNGAIATWDWDATLGDFLKTYMLPYLSISKDCEALLYYNTCTSADGLYLDKNHSVSTTSGYDIVLSDGTRLFFHFDGAGDLWVYADVNGAKKPNIIGKDIFFMQLKKTGNTIVFFNYGFGRDKLLSGTSWSCDKTVDWMAGAFCGALIQMDGWQIKDDYPWN